MYFKIEQRLASFENLPQRRFGLLADVWHNFARRFANVIFHRHAIHFGELLVQPHPAQLII